LDITIIILIKIMATILIQPDSLSLSSNLKKFEIAASTQVRFKLALGGSYIIDETYSPNAAGRVVIDIKDVVKQHLSLALPSSDIFQQTGIIKTFSAEIDSLSAVSFTVIRAGVENLADTATNFLTANWLTWQQQTKQAGYYQPEWLTYYAPVAAVIKVKFYLKDGSTSIITLHSPAAGTCYTYNTQFSYIMSLQAGEKYGYYDVWAENVGGNRLTYVQRYVYREQEDADEFFVFENSLGGLDTAVMNGESIFSPEMEHSEGLYDDIAQQLDGTVTRLFEKNTGWKSKSEADWLFDFFNSLSRYKVAEGTLRRITIKESSVSDSSQEDLKSFTFVYRLAQDLGLLNIPRTMDPPPANLEILTPEGLFFLAPRLNEFPQAEITPELLFPVQSPYTQEWKKISYQQLIDEIDKSIGEGVVRMEIDSSLGWMIGTNETTSLSVKVYKRWVDITSLMATWVWTRTSGDAADDLIWNQAHTALTNTAQISFADLGNSLQTNVSCKFTITATYDKSTVSTTIEI